MVIGVHHHHHHHHHAHSLGSVSCLDAPSGKSNDMPGPNSLLTTQPIPAAQIHEFFNYVLFGIRLCGSCRQVGATKRSTKLQGKLQLTDLHLYIIRTYIYARINHDTGGGVLCFRIGQ